MRWLSILLVAAGLATPAVADNITVYSSGSIAINDSRQLTAYVPLSPNTVTWSVNGIPGGDSTVGTVSATGLYKSPAQPPSNNAVTVKAQSTAYADKSGTATLTITQPVINLWSISPTSVPVGAFTLRLNGSNFTPESQVFLGPAVGAVTYGSAQSLTVKGTATQAGKLQIVVRDPRAGGTVSAAVMLTVTTADAGGGTTPTPTPEPTPSPTPTPAVTVAMTPNTVTVAPLKTQQFTASVTGNNNASVTYSVNGVNGGNATVGTISGAGLYTAPSTAPSPATVTIRATSVAAPTSYASSSVTVMGPPNAGTGKGTANLAAARFLEQASFGPTPAEIQKVNTVGVDAWLAEQFAMPETAITNPGSQGSGLLQQQYLSRLTTAPDQLRQRVAYALSQIIVISMNKNIYPDEIVPYLQILSANAFGNYRTLLGQISTSSQMGKYLDIANSNKPSPGASANENYARELMQLFSIGLVELNPDGSPKVDANNQTKPTYDQTTVQQVALALTGWTYIGAQNNNWENFTGPLQPKDVNHDMRAKSFLGCTLLAGRTAVQDMNDMLDCVFAHPNVGPFVSLRLIRQLVTSNPSSAYVSRVAAVFNDNGSGVRGDLKAVVKAILTDTEARNNAGSPTSGKVKDPILHIAGFVRALNGTIAPANGLSWEFSQVAQTPLTPPSVFGFYSPLYRIPKSSLQGPELQIYTPTESVLRGNMMWRIITNPGSDYTVDLSPFSSVATDPIALIDAADQLLLYGRMPQTMRQSLANAMAAQSDPTSRWQTALYLTALSGFYATQY